MSKRFLWHRSELKELRAGNARGLLSAFSSLKVRNFRLYFIGQCISLSGRWIQSIAMSWLVYRLTGSVVMLSVVAFVNQIPTLLLGPVAGVLSDRYNRFTILILTQATLMLSAAVLGILSLTDTIEVWHIMVVGLISGVAAGIDAPARQSFYTKLVSADSMTNAIALNSVTFNGSRLVGPALGGLMIGIMGEGWCFVANAISYIAVFISMYMMRLDKFVPTITRSNAMLQFKEGFGYIREYMPLRTVLIFVSVISCFGMPFMNVLPALVKDTLGGDSMLLGYVNSSIGAGALTAAFYLAMRKRVHGLGKVLTITAVAMGVAFILLSFVETPVLAVLLAYPIGCSLIGSRATSNTLLQLVVDDDKRGRVMSFYTMASQGLTPLGGLLYGWLADTASLPVTIAVSGVICLAAGCIYEFHRPKVREATLDRMAAENCLVPEIATAINEEKNPF
jgi:MFS family permease